MMVSDNMLMMIGGGALTVIFGGAAMLLRHETGLAAMRATMEHLQSEISAVRRNTEEMRELLYQIMRDQ